MVAPDPVFPKASGGVMAETGKEASCERGSGAEVVHTSAKGADRRDEIQENPMTDTDVRGRLYLPVYRLNRGGKMVTELGRRTFETEDGARQVPRGPFVPKPIEVVDVVEIVYPPAALSAAEATGAPAPVSGERDWRALETAAWHLDQANKPALATLVRDAATALRTPHLPGEEELVLLMRQNLSVDVSNYGLSADIEGIEDAARAILSRLTASREDK